MKDLGIVLRVLGAVGCGLISLYAAFLTAIYAYNVVKYPGPSTLRMWATGLVPLTFVIVPAMLCVMLLRGARAAAKS